ncbi:MAG TPA: hypothetical protein VJY33_24920 [Isosphaeraceae bacterium]|nr:hypothetical protein [Isosphaeraceae bacterium]
MTTVIHLTASTFHGGPERQMLGLAGGMNLELPAQDCTAQEENILTPLDEHLSPRQSQYRWKINS